VEFVKAGVSGATHTVKSHVQNILEKLALHTRLEVAIYDHDQDRDFVPSAPHRVVTSPPERESLTTTDRIA
jgi:hypothetical protein